VVRTVEGVEGVVRRTVEGVAGVVGSLGQGVVAGGLRQADLLLQGPLPPAHALRQQHAVTLAHAVHLPTLDPLQHKLTGGFFFCVLYSTLLHLPPLRFHCVGGCWDRTQDCCDFGIGSQPL
jgi:hypothetical protein